MPVHFPEDRTPATCLAVQKFAFAKTPLAFEGISAPRVFEQDLCLPLRFAGLRTLEPIAFSLAETILN